MNKVIRRMKDSCGPKEGEPDEHKLVHRYSRGPNRLPRSTDCRTFDGDEQASRPGCFWSITVIGPARNNRKLATDQFHGNGRLVCGASTFASPAGACRSAAASVGVFRNDVDQPAGVEGRITCTSERGEAVLTAVLRLANRPSKITRPNRHRLPNDELNERPELMQATKQPNHENDWNWNSDQPQQQTSAHHRSPFLSAGPIGLLPEPTA